MSAGEESFDRPADVDRRIPSITEESKQKLKVLSEQRQEDPSVTIEIALDMLKWATEARAAGNHIFRVGDERHGPTSRFEMIFP